MYIYKMRTIVNLAIIAIAFSLGSCKTEIDSIKVTVKTVDKGIETPLANFKIEIDQSNVSWLGGDIHHSKTIAAAQTDANGSVVFEKVKIRYNSKFKTVLEYDKPKGGAYAYGPALVYHDGRKVNVSPGAGFIPVSFSKDQSAEILFEKCGVWDFRVNPPATKMTDMDIDSVIIKPVKIYGRLYSVPVQYNSSFYLRGTSFTNDQPVQVKWQIPTGTNIPVEIIRKRDGKRTVQTQLINVSWNDTTRQVVDF
jgi:hypothetical protein